MAVLDLGLPMAMNPMEIVKVCILIFVSFCDTELLLAVETVEGNINYENLPVLSDK